MMKIQCLKQAAFWLLFSTSLCVVFPLWIILIVVFVHEKSTNGLFILGYDTLLQRWLLHICGARGDPHSELILENGVPGVEYFKELPNVNFHLIYYGLIRPFTYISELTGYTPDFMRTDPDPTGIGSLYNTRMNYIDEIVEKNFKNGIIKQILIIGAGWDFRGVATKMSYPDIKVVEVDIPKMIDVKKDICQEKGIKYSQNVETVPIELKSKSDVKELRNHIDMDNKTLIILEGVSVFLKGEVNEGLLELLRDLPGGSELVADYWIKESWTWWNVLSKRWGKMLLKMIMKMIGEPIKFELTLCGESATTTIDSFVKYATRDQVEVIESEDIYIGVLTRIRSCL